MTGRGLIAALCLCASGVWASTQAQDASLDVPSGQPITFSDVIWGEAGPEGVTVRFRFVAPRIQRDLGVMTFIEAEADMAHLCETYVLPRIAAPGPEVSQIVISLSDRKVAFGEAAPDVTQFFEAYRPEAGTCIWEGF